MKKNVSSLKLKTEKGIKLSRNSIYSENKSIKSNNYILNLNNNIMKKLFTFLLLTFLFMSYGIIAQDLHRSQNQSIERTSPMNPESSLKILRSKNNQITNN